MCGSGQGWQTVQLSRGYIVYHSNIVNGGSYCLAVQSGPFENSALSSDHRLTLVLSSTREFCVCALTQRPSEGIAFGFTNAFCVDLFFAICAKIFSSKRWGRWISLGKVRSFSIHHCLDSLPGRTFNVLVSYSLVQFKCVLL